MGDDQRDHLRILLDPVSLRSEARTITNPARRLRLDRPAGRLTRSRSPVASSRTILIAGAGIGGLTAALTLARAGYRVVIAEQAEKLTDIGAGIQLSPNATRILQSLGVAERLDCERRGAGRIVDPQRADPGRDRLYADRASDGISLWRAVLDACIAATCRRRSSKPSPSSRMSFSDSARRVEDFAIHAKGITAQLRDARGISEERVPALIGADGLWSTDQNPARRRHPNRTSATARRGAPSCRHPPCPKRFARPVTRLWLGENAHLVHYPVRGGTLDQRRRDRAPTAGSRPAGPRRAHAINCFVTSRPSAGPSPRAISWRRRKAG